MREWIPIPGSNREILIRTAIEEFSRNGYSGVNINELAKLANMTTGAVYHHFGSKANLYEVVRTDIEQRLLDRMEAAASLFEEQRVSLKAALTAGLNFAADYHFCGLLSEETPYVKEDRVEQFLSIYNELEGVPVSLVLIASLRSILQQIHIQQLTKEQGKKLVDWMLR